MRQKIKLIKQIHLFKKGFVIFLKGATFSDLIDIRLLSYKCSGIKICFPLFWRIYFQLGSILVKFKDPALFRTVKNIQILFNLVNCTPLPGMTSF